MSTKTKKKIKLFSHVASRANNWNVLKCKTSCRRNETHIYTLSSKYKSNALGYVVNVLIQVYIDLHLVKILVHTEINTFPENALVYVTNRSITRFAPLVYSTNTICVTIVFRKSENRHKVSFVAGTCPLQWRRRQDVRIIYTIYTV